MTKSLPETINTILESWDHELYDFSMIKQQYFNSYYEKYVLKTNEIILHYILEWSYTVDMYVQYYYLY